MPVAEEFVAVLNDLVSSANQVNLVLVVKLSHDVFSKRKAHTTVIIAPVIYFFVWVRPQEVAQESCVRDVCRSDYVIDGQDFV